ncbi:transcription factor PCL1-like [Magnolia sinica]|uniref:transcription factor PCL1-like n=1 Tax=Magnolia sinica TaxID=86752 RepID=UPI002658969E|nr:transcription factor PCL1-like [Magnolia sinica]XP_058099330.1 transcription factor PCL1-like [Magnolia sinica]XP_058099331.1 transcription factor PCL1-like [Magnolia sinica]
MRGGDEEDGRTCSYVLATTSEEDPHVMEWETGLPSSDDLMPLSQPLIPPELASAFCISPEPSRTVIDVTRASHSTLSSLCNRQMSSIPSNGFQSFPSFEDRDDVEDSARDGMDSGKGRKFDSGGEEPDDDQSARALKRPRLVWTPQLHKRFIDVVAHLGIKNAVPKTIMQLMNVEGLTRENVASHLQKYRQYLKRMHGLSSSEGPSSSDQLFNSTPVPHEPGDWPGPTPMPNMSPYLHMPVLGVPHEGNGNRHLAPMPMNNPGHAAAAYYGFESQHYNLFNEQRRDWVGN